MTDPTANDDSYTLAGAMACKWLAAYYAQDDQAGDILRALTVDPRGLALSFGALGELFVSTLSRLDADGVLEGGVQVWLDRAALSFGAAADDVVKRHRDTPPGDAA
jgi:hypothetical protein